jgi:hypothetical protein
MKKFFRDILEWIALVLVTVGAMLYWLFIVVMVSLTFLIPLWLFIFVTCMLIKFIF